MNDKLKKGAVLVLFLVVFSGMVFMATNRESASAAMTSEQLIKVMDQKLSSKLSGSITDQKLDALVDRLEATIATLSARPSGSSAAYGLSPCSGFSIDKLNSPVTFRTKNHKGFQRLVCPIQDCPAAFQVPELPYHFEPINACTVAGRVVNHASAKYVETIKQAVFGLHCRDADAMLPVIGDGHADPPDVPNCIALSMAGLRRANNLQALLQNVMRQGIEGDFIETGTWRGGLCLLAAATFDSYGQLGPRKVWLADSFEGIPPAEHPVDKANHAKAHLMKQLNQGGPKPVQGYFKRYGFTDPESIKWIVGWFKDSLPKAERENWSKENTKFSVMRLDGDMYTSVYDSLKYIYPRLSEGGYVIIDDFTDWAGAVQAVYDYMAEQKIEAPLYPVHHRRGEQVRGVYWQKPKTR